MSEQTSTAEAPATAPAADPAHPPGLVLGVVAAHIEPVTRFDAADLTQTAPEETYGLPVEITVDQFVSFSESVHTGPARLPAGTDKHPGEYGFRQDLSERLARAQEEAPRALQAWANEQVGSYRRLMPRSAGFLRAPGTVGYEHTCHQCSGACQVSCPSCSGVGHTNCHACFGAGKINCYSCHGTKHLSCSSCGGRGSWTEQVSQQTWNHSSNSYVTSYQTVYRSCSACSSSGRTTCYHCGYDGKISCSGCFGKGHIDCARCHATGRIDCPGCLASGIQHVRGTITAEVVHDETLSVVTPDETLRALVEHKVPREDMPQLGALLDVLHSVQGQALETRHRLRLDVRRASLRASDDDFVLYGFGPEARVFSFENIAGHMLADDLATLDSSTQHEAGVGERVVAAPANVSVEPLETPSLEQYRFLYNSVGSNHYWVDRNKLSDEALAQIVQHALVEISVLQVGGDTAGYAELDRRQPGEVELAYFGIFPEYIGRGLGKYFLFRAVKQAWSYTPRRVWLHTCDLDHAAALPNYLKAGFTIYDEQTVIQPLQ